MLPSHAPSLQSSSPVAYSPTSCRRFCSSAWIGNGWVKAGAWGWAQRGMHSKLAHNDCMQGSSQPRRSQPAAMLSRPAGGQRSHASDLDRTHRQTLAEEHGESGRGAVSWGRAGARTRPPTHPPTGSERIRWITPSLTCGASSAGGTRNRRRLTRSNCSSCSVQGRQAEGGTKRRISSGAL